MHLVLLKSILVNYIRTLEQCLLPQVSMTIEAQI